MINFFFRFFCVVSFVLIGMYYCCDLKNIRLRKLIIRELKREKKIKYLLLLLIFCLGVFFFK